MKRGFVDFAVLSGLAMLGACASPQRRPVDADRVQLEVPFFSDESDQCGPATLASLLTFWDQPTEPKQLRSQIYNYKTKGTIPLDLLVAAEERGMQARSFQANLDEVKEELKLGHPVLAFLNEGTRLFPRGHFVLITGFDDARGGFFLHTRRAANRFVGYGSFMSTWERTGRWAIMVMPAGEATTADRAARTL